MGDRHMERCGGDAGQHTVITHGSPARLPGVEAGRMEGRGKDNSSIFIV